MKDDHCILRQENLFAAITENFFPLLNWKSRNSSDEINAKVPKKPKYLIAVKTFFKIFILDDIFWLKDRFLFAFYASSPPAIVWTSSYCLARAPEFTGSKIKAFLVKRRLTSEACYSYFWNIPLKIEASETKFVPEYVTR